MSNFDKNIEIQRLKEMDVGEVSIVDKGANKRQWIMKKRDSEEGKLVLLFEKANEGDQGAITEILKSWKIEDATLTEAGFQKVTKEPVAKESAKTEGKEPEESVAKDKGMTEEGIKKMIEEGIKVGIESIAKNTKKPAETDGSQSDGDDEDKDDFEKSEGLFEVIGLQEIE